MAAREQTGPECRQTPELQGKLGLNLQLQPARDRGLKGQTRTEAWGLQKDICTVQRSEGIDLRHQEPKWRVSVQLGGSLNLPQCSALTEG